MLPLVRTLKYSELEVNFGREIAAVRDAADDAAIKPAAEAARPQACGGIVDIEFDPPDATTLRGRITVIRPPHGRREIVIVDDDLEFPQTFGALLRHEGYAVVTEATWFSALQYLRHHVPDVLITDVWIGGANGWELAKYAKQRHPMMPVIIVTGFAPTDAEKVALQYLVEAGATIVEMGVTVGGTDTPPADARSRELDVYSDAIHEDLLDQIKAGHISAKQEE